MDIFLAIVCIILITSTVCDVIMSIRNFIYQKKWSNEKKQIICDDPAITDAELCARYVDFCAQNHCLVEY